MIAYLQSTLSLLFEGLAVNPGVWLVVALAASIGGWLVGMIHRAPTRIAAATVWTMLPVLVASSWLASCGTGDDASNGNCFGASFAFVIASVALPVWAAAALAGIVLSRRRGSSKVRRQE